MNKIILIMCTALFPLMSGCATLLPELSSPSAGIYTTKKYYSITAKISSTPSGATMEVWSLPFWNKTTVGETPAEIFIDKPRSTLCMFTVAKEGFETEYLLIKETFHDTSFELQERFDQAIAKELKSYPKEYINAAFDIASKYDKAINSPRFLSGSVASEARNDAEKLSINFPNLKKTSLSKALAKLNMYFSWISIAGADSATEKRFATELLLLITKIKNGLSGGSDPS